MEGSGVCELGMGCFSSRLLGFVRETVAGLKQAKRLEKFPNMIEFS